MKKRLKRELEGVNDLFARAIRLIVENWKPTNFKWVAVPELHKCQTSCHWQEKKSKKKGWKNHDTNFCHCPTKHSRLRNWHIHMLATDFLPAQYAHEKCGLGKFDQSGSPRGCWDHRGYIAHEIWPYGLVDIKRISHCKVTGRPIKNAEQVGLLKEMSIYKFFRVIYGYHSDTDLPFIAAKVQKPQVSSQVFINNDYGFTEEVEKEFRDYLAKISLITFRKFYSNNYFTTSVTKNLLVAE